MTSVIKHVHTQPAKTATLLLTTAAAPTSPGGVVMMFLAVMPRQTYTTTTSISTGRAPQHRDSALRPPSPGRPLGRSQVVVVWMGAGTEQTLRTSVDVLDVLHTRTSLFCAALVCHVTH